MPRQTSCRATSSGSSAGRHPVEPLAPAGCRRPAAAPRPGPGRGRPSVTCTCGSPASRPSAAPIAGVPCSGVNSPKKTTRSASGSARGPAAYPASNQAAGAPTGTTTPASARSAGTSRPCSRLSTTTRRPLRSARRSSRASSRIFTRAGLTAVGGGVGGEDEVVEHERRPGGTAAGPAARRSGRGSRPAPRPAAAGGTPARPRTVSTAQHRASRSATGGQPPGLPQHGHPAGGVESERHVDLDDLVAVRAQALDQHAHPGVRLGRRTSRRRGPSHTSTLVGPARPGQPHAAAASTARRSPESPGRALGPQGISVRASSPVPDRRRPSSRSGP